jgi:probable aminopeptidase NPEPL1
MHIDMAAPVHNGERATGYGVALLTSLFGRYTSSALLSNIGPSLEETEDGRESDKKKMRLN